MSNEFVLIKGYGGAYAINNQGDIVSYKRAGKTVPVAHVGKPGHAKRVNLSPDKTQQDSCRVDRLVALHFVGNPNNYRYLHNLSGDPADVSHTNLEWRDYPPRKFIMSREDRAKLAAAFFACNLSIEEFAKGYTISSRTVRSYILEWSEDNDYKEEYDERMEQNVRDNISKYRLNRSTPVSQYTAKGVLVREYRSLTEASSLTDIPVQRIYYSVHNPNKQAGGFIWKLTLPKTTP